MKDRIKAQAGKELGDILARRTALLDQLQAVIENHKGLLGEERFQDEQDNIDRFRFQVELDKLAVRIKYGE